MEPAVPWMYKGGRLCPLTPAVLEQNAQQDARIN